MLCLGRSSTVDFGVGQEVTSVPYVLMYSIYICNDQLILTFVGHNHPNNEQTY